MAYVSAAALLATLGVTSPSSQQTNDATTAVNAASSAIDNICSRPGTTSRDGFGLDANASQVRYFSPTNTGELEITDLVTLTSLVSRDDGGNVDTSDSGLQTWTVNTDFTLGPLNAAAEGVPYTVVTVNANGSYRFNTLYPRSVKLTGKFGWPVTPAPILDACTMLAERFYKMKREAPMGAYMFADMGTAVRVAAADRNVMILLADYILHRAAVA